MNEQHNASELGKAFKTLLNRIKKEAFTSDCDDNSCERYGCLVCKHFQRSELYDQQWGNSYFGLFKCKKQPDKNMMLRENYYHDRSVEKCPYFERGENELIYMSEREKKECMQ